MQEVIIISDLCGQVSDVNLTGFTRANTAEMRLFLRITDEGGGGFGVFLSNSNTVVASGFASGPNPVVELLPAGSSGISGSLQLNAATEASGISLLLGWADIFDLKAYESSIDMWLPNEAADFYLQQSEAFFQINQVLRHKFRDELSSAGRADLSRIAEPAALKRAQTCYVLYLLYNDRAARLEDVNGVYAKGRDRYYALYEREMASITIALDVDGDGQADTFPKTGSVKISRA